MSHTIDLLRSLRSYKNWKNKQYVRPMEVKCLLLKNVVFHLEKFTKSGY